MERRRFLYGISMLFMCIFLFPTKVRAAEEYLEITGQAGILQDGQLFSTADSFYSQNRLYLGSGDTTAADIYEALYQGMRERQEEIDIYSYRIPRAQFQDIWVRVINTHEDLFYVKGGSAMSDGTYLVSYTVTYKEEYTRSDEEIFYKTCDSIIAGMPSGLTDQQKTLYLHDYLVTHCEYDLSLSNFTAYNALVDGSAVCQGYALAYSYLCKKAGIEVYMVTSSENAHAWNLLVLGGTYYFVDCTWDDPSNHCYEAYCKHVNYLISRDSLVATGHKNSRLDWTSDILGNVSQIGVGSTTYDSYYWSDVITAMPFIGTVQAYAKKDDYSNVYLRTNDGTVTTVPIGRRAMWFVWGSSNSYYTTSYISVAAIRDSFYFSTESAIYKLSADGRVELFYELTPEEKSVGYLYGIVSEKNVLAYNLGTQAMDNENFVRKQITVSAPMVMIDFAANGGTGGMNAIELDQGSIFVLPDCGFTAPEGMVFSGWSVNGTNYAVGASIVVNEDLSLQATWKLFVDTSSPKLLSVTAEESGVAVTWKANAGIDRYTVFRKVDSGKWTKLTEVTGTSYLDTTATAGHTYGYTVRGMDDAGNYITSYNTTGKSVKLAEAIDKSSPVMLSVTAGEGGVTVTWKANTGVAKYTVFRKVDSGKWTKLTEVTGTSYLDTTATAGHTYGYTVRGMNAAGSFVTSYDTTGMSVKLAEAIDKSSPVMLSVTAGTDGVAVTWKANTGVAKYTVFRKVDSGKWTKLTEVTGTSYLDTTAAAGHTYGYTVRGMNAAGSYVTSYDTTGMSVKLAEAIDKSSPVLLSVTAGTDGVAVAWKANTGVTKYAVFRKVDSGKWTRLAVVEGTSYLDTTATAGHTYGYTVRGMNAAGSYVTSYDTTGMSVKLEESIDKSSPVLLSATADGSGVTVAWTANNGVDHYAVFRKTVGGNWVKIKETKGTASGAQASAGETCSYLDDTVQPGTTYIYSVRGMNAAGKYVTSYDASGVTALAE